MTADGAVHNDAEAVDSASESLTRVVALHCDPERTVDEGYVPLSYPGMRVLGSHMVLILTLTQMLEQRPGDTSLQALAQEMVEGITVNFWNEKYRLMSEALACDLTRPADDNEDFSYLGHAIETMWMTMVEALRLGDRALFDLSAERLRPEFPEFHLEADQPVYLTGEMMWPGSFDELGALRPMKEAAELLAQKEDWPTLYDREALAANEVPVAAAVYENDMYVDREYSLETAEAIKGAKVWRTADYEHNGLRADGATILGHLMALLRG